MNEMSKILHQDGTLGKEDAEMAIVLHCQTKNGPVTTSSTIHFFLGKVTLKIEDEIIFSPSKTFYIQNAQVG